MNLCTQIEPSHLKLVVLCICVYAMEYDYYDRYSHTRTQNCHFTKNVMVNNMINTKPLAVFLFDAFACLVETDYRSLYKMYVHILLPIHLICYEKMLRGYSHDYTQISMTNEVDPLLPSNSRRSCRYSYMVASLKSIESTALLV